VHERASAWFARRTSRAADWPVEGLVARKAGARVSVVIPARNEEPTIAGIVTGIRRELMSRHRLVDELVVMDSDSTDGTAAVARAAGAEVYPVRSVRPDLGEFAGKGEALWKSQFVTTGDLLVFIDADLTEWGTHFVSGLLGPLLADNRTELVKGYYDRLLDDGSSTHTPQGGRVTELVARPLLNLHWPELAAVVQPLAGEWAVRRTCFETLPVPVGYGVEMAGLLDVFARDGLDAIAQVDLGERAHSHQSVHDLAVMAAEILAVAGRRLHAEPTRSGQLWQFDRRTDPPWRDRAVPLDERPPAQTLIDRSARAAAR
jgi:glucosyl-3-phosphoglycerate synthase